MNIHTGEALRACNTLALQSRAQAFASVHNRQELLAVLAEARSLGLAVIPLGEGSNVVFVGDVNALVLRQETRGIELLERDNDSVNLRIAAGESWHQLVQWTLERGYFGLENLALIPGTVGAAPIQNIGAYGIELRSSLLQVHAIRLDDGEEITLSNAACEFGYRDSIFKHALRDKVIITTVDLQLSLQGKVNIGYPALKEYFGGTAAAEVTPQAVFDAVVSIRRSKLPDPSIVPNAGSFFKNPVIGEKAAAALQKDYPALPVFPQQDGSVKLSAAWLIDQCGWKGFRRDNLGVHEQHALVLVNYGNGSGRQLLSLANEIAASVEKAFGVRLEIEPRVYGSAV